MLRLDERLNGMSIDLNGINRVNRLLGKQTQLNGVRRRSAPTDGQGRRDNYPRPHDFSSPALSTGLILIKGLVIL